MSFFAHYLTPLLLSPLSRCSGAHLTIHTRAGAAPPFTKSYCTLSNSYCTLCSKTHYFRPCTAMFSWSWYCSRRASYGTRATSGPWTHFIQGPLRCLWTCKRRFVRCLQILYILTLLTCLNLDATPSKCKPPPQKCTVSLWPSPLTSDLENPFSNSHAHDEYLCKVLLKFLHYTYDKGRTENGRTDGRTAYPKTYRNASDASVVGDRGIDMYYMIHNTVHLTLQ